ncbi:ribosome maturation factor RimM [Leptolyngbya sp. AN02str]|uniref:ribosome maturation factor RimM n=1 Tax=Leptolyngbya sp. AN02str TaxID=3423363 RepID=UPI003D319896
MAEWIPIGKIVGAQGLKGEVRVYPDTDFPERFEDPGQRWLLQPGATEPQPIELKSGRLLPGKGLYVLKLGGITDRTQAEALRDCLLVVDERDRPQLDDDEYHVRDLLGLSVVDQVSQVLIGTVTDVIPAGNDLLQVELANPQTKAKTVLIPFVKAIVPIVDLTQQRIEITPPAGLIEGSVQPSLDESISTLPNEEPM